MSFSRTVCSRLGALCGLLFVTSPAWADRAVLAGGTTLEGKVTREGDRVVIETPSGTIRLPAESVDRIEEGQSPLEHFEARHAALAPKDVRGRLALADYCRDHDMPARERSLLMEVIALAPNHELARARLGHEKTASGWMTREEAMRARGLVRHEGRWITETERAELERRREEATDARRRADERERAESASRELEAARRELEQARARLEAERLRAETRRQLDAEGASLPPYFATTLITQPFGKRAVLPCRRPQRRATPSRARGPFDTTKLSVVKVPYRSSR